MTDVIKNISVALLFILVITIYLTIEQTAVSITKTISATLATISISNGELRYFNINTGYRMYLFTFNFSNVTFNGMQFFKKSSAPI